MGSLTGNCGVWVPIPALTGRGQRGPARIRRDHRLHRVDRDRAATSQAGSPQLADHHAHLAGQQYEYRLRGQAARQPRC